MARALGHAIYPDADSYVALCLQVRDERRSVISRQANARPWSDCTTSKMKSSPHETSPRHGCGGTDQGPGASRLQTCATNRQPYTA